jgi:hypothetical protein
MRAEAQTSGGLSLGGISLGFSQQRILLTYKIIVAGYLAVFYFTAQAATFEAIFCALLLILTAFLPGYLWCTSKAKGLPIVPALALFFIPTYALPVQTASKVLQVYTPAEQAEGILFATGYLFIITLIWHQICNRSARPAKNCYMIDPAKSVNWMISILLGYLALQLFGQVLPGSIFTLLRGILLNGSALACFILSFYAGQGKLTKNIKLVFFVLLSLSILLEAASLILASSLVRLAVVVAGYGLGCGKIPWKQVSVLVGIVWLLHAGKAQMREEFWQEGILGTTKAEVWEYPMVFARWLEVGWEKTFLSTKEKEEAGDQSAAERGSLLNVFLKIKSLTPSKVPYLEGLTYREIPKLLVPRFLNKEKGFSHIGNMYLAYLYGFTPEENLTKVSIQFDLMMEGYANFGVLGVVGIAIGIGLLLGTVSRISTGVPLMSFRFFFAILVLNTILGTNNTLAVFLTTLWQGAIGLMLLSWLMMKKLPNPLYAKPEKMTGGERGQEEAMRIEEIEARGSPNPQSSVLNPEPAAPVRHERPKRFVYGKEK